MVIFLYIVQYEETLRKLNLDITYLRKHFGIFKEMLKDGWLLNKSFCLQ